ncbi:hypothetical protein LTR37_001631 [Vermiconidia calcicola]|uniref:Uncharacterized protein n=1 Tax=Vermiconidia calcicola TaxID=1690605 RepID=A0ACC3NVD3_9PEZI|nr:hypothetical protein LTR37_001631 [Vermiconidia calcicola]
MPTQNGVDGCVKDKRRKTAGGHYFPAGGFDNECTRDGSEEWKKTARFILEYFDGNIANSTQKKAKPATWHAERIANNYETWYRGCSGKGWCVREQRQVYAVLVEMIRRHNQDFNKIKSRDLILCGSAVFDTKELSSWGYGEQYMSEYIGNGMGLKATDSTAEPQLTTVEDTRDDVMSETSVEVMPSSKPRDERYSGRTWPEYQIPAASVGDDGLEPGGSKRHRVHTPEELSSSSTMSDPANTPRSMLDAHVTDHEQGATTPTATARPEGVQTTASISTVDRDQGVETNTAESMLHAFNYVENFAGRHGVDPTAPGRFSFAGNENLEKLYAAIIGTEHVADRKARVVRSLDIRSSVSSLVGAFLWLNVFQCHASPYSKWADGVQEALGCHALNFKRRVSQRGVRSTCAQCYSSDMYTEGVSLDTQLRESYLTTMRDPAAPKDISTSAEHLGQLLAAALQTHLDAQQRPNDDATPQSSCQGSFFDLCARVQPTIVRAIRLKCELSVSTRYEQYRFDWCCAGSAFNKHVMEASNGGEGTVVATLFPGLLVQRDGEERSVAKMQVITC